MSGRKPRAIAEPANALYAYIGAFVDELRRAGVEHVVACPGSRSTPLALALAEQPGIRLWMHVDERSAGFFALGMARRLQRPVALLCTSGTAAANFYPAVIEARLSHVPLLALTADRPHELRDCGAPQAIDQNRLYGQHVKWYMEIAPANATNQSLRYIRTMAARAAATATAAPAGPVHLNFPFADPLIPLRGPLMPAEERDSVAWNGRPNGVAYTAVTTASPPAPRLAELAARLRAAPRGLIVAGPQLDSVLAEPLLALAHTLGYPVLADPLSQLRIPDVCNSDDATLVTTYDAFLLSESELKESGYAAVNGAGGDQFVPDIILRFGAMPTSKPLMLYLEHHARRCPLIVVSGTQSWDESTQLASEMIYSDPVEFCARLVRLAATSRTPAGGNSSNRSRSEWESLWRTTENHTRRALDEAVADLPELFEGRVVTELTQLLPPESTLFAGNSMPVRDLDTFFSGSRAPVRVAANRGANGIDGVVSTALGMSAVAPAGEHTALVIGDLSFYHDSNGLLAAHLHQLDLSIILVNNDGGGIFSFLPQTAYPEHFEQLFGTPTGLDFRPLVEMYGGKFERVCNWNDFRRAVSSSWQTGGLRVIEVPSNRDANLSMHRQVRQRVRHTLRRSGVMVGAVSLAKASTEEPEGIPGDR